MVTKWDLISAEERASLERTPLSVPCSGCNTPLETEADVAKHFVLMRRSPNEYYLNLGWCPVKEGWR